MNSPSRGGAVLSSAEGDGGTVHGLVVVVRCDMPKSPLLDNFEARGWSVCGARDGASDSDSAEDSTPTAAMSREWVLWWASVQNVRSFHSATGLAPQRFLPHQRVNHFPNHWELTRKDRMYAHIVRYSKALLRRPASSNGQRDANTNAQLSTHLSHRGETVRDFAPVTFALPGEYAMFADAAKTAPGATWIVKPANKSQGRGIFLVPGAAHIPQAMRDRSNATARSEPHIVSRYVDRPLLVDGRKFDLRIFVLVTNFRPLRAFRHEAAFARFCRTGYPCRMADGSKQWLQDLSGHLTNTSLARRTGEGALTKPGLDGVAGFSHEALVQRRWAGHGGKWPWENVLLFVASRYGDEARQQLVRDVDFAIVESLRAVQAAIINDQHSFELYGYDVLIDEQLKPWLVEVNASPSLEPATAADRAVKTAVISDTLDLVAPVDAPDMPLAALRQLSIDELPANGFTCIASDR